jgi:hypothetical protein
VAGNGEKISEAYRAQYYRKATRSGKQGYQICMREIQLIDGREVSSEQDEFFYVFCDYSNLTAINFWMRGETITYNRFQR